MIGKIKHIRIWLSGLSLVVVSCTVGDITDGSTSLVERVSSLEEQIPAINESIGDLEKTDEALVAVIDSLEQEMMFLQQQMELLDSAGVRDSARIIHVRSRFDSLAQLLPGLEASDSSLNAQMDELKTYVTNLADSTDADTQTWLRNTFVTLSKMDSLTGVVAEIRLQMEDFSESFGNDVSEALTDLQESMQNWVLDSLTAGYYTIAEVDAKLKPYTDPDSVLKTEIKALKAGIDSARAQLTRDYQEILRTSIETMEGGIDRKLSEDIDAAKSELEGRLGGIMDKVSELEERTAKAETDTYCILSRIRSISVVADCMDGSILILQGDESFEVKLSIYPLDAADSIAKSQIPVSLELVQTETKTSSMFTTLTVSSVKYEDELLILTVSTEGLPESVLYGEKIPFARAVFFTDRFMTGSDFFPLKYISLKMEAQTVDMFVNDILSLKPSIVPEEYRTQLIFSSSDSSVALVDNDGTLMARGVGSAVVKVHVAGMESICDSCFVNVVQQNQSKL